MNHRITYKATDEGRRRAEKALRKEGFESKTAFADLCDLGRSTITSFFSGNRIKPVNFKTICSKLELDWEEIVDRESFDTNENIEQQQNSCHLTTQRRQATYKFHVTVDEENAVNFFNDLLRLVQKLGDDDSIEITDIEQGSIKLTLKGSPAGLQKLEQSFQSGELNQRFEQELKITVEDVVLLNTSSVDNDLQNKSLTTGKTQLAFTIAGYISQANIDILKAALIKAALIGGNYAVTTLTNSEKSRHSKKSLNPKRRRIRISATSEGVERAIRALIRLGFETKTNFAKSTLISRNVVYNFFLKREIQVNSFKRICEKLTLDWQEIAELLVEQSLTPEVIQARDSIEVNEDTQLISTSDRQIVVRDRQCNVTKAVISLQGDLDSLENSNIVLSILKEYGGNTIIIEDIKKGSIKIFISGSSEDVERLKSRIQSGEIKEINGFPVENIEIINKWDLIEEIVNHSVKNRSLGSVDLSDADLSGADLKGADLKGADLSGADLSIANLGGADLRGADLSSANLDGADLGGADLRGADLSSANLRSADLRGADLSSANLSEAYLIVANLSGADLSSANLSDAYLIVANLSGADLRSANLRGSANLRSANLSSANLSSANVEKAYFSNRSSGISEPLKSDLIARGAIFDDSPSGEI